MDLEATKEAVIELLTDNAAWRERKARQFPGDERNLDAVEESRRLAAVLEALPPEAFAGYAGAEARLFDEEADETAAVLALERQGALLRGIGFQWFPHDGRELLAGLTAALEGDQEES